MIAHFIRPAEEQNLVRCAVIILLCSLFTLVAPFLVGGLLKYLLPSVPVEWCVGVPLAIWAIWIISEYRRVVRLVQTATYCDRSPAALHAIQATAVGLFIVRFAFDDGLRFLSIYVICVDCALAAFFLSYFVLAAFSRMRLPWHSYIGFMVTCASLYFSMSSFNRSS